MLDAVIMRSMSSGEFIENSSILSNSSKVILPLADAGVGSLLIFGSLLETSGVLVLVVELVDRSQDSVASGGSLGRGFEKGLGVMDLVINL